MTAADTTPPAVAGTTEQEVDALIRAAADAHYACGEWTHEDDEEFATLADRAEQADDRLRAALLASCAAPTAYECGRWTPADGVEYGLAQAESDAVRADLEAYVANLTSQLAAARAEIAALRGQDE